MSFDLKPLTNEIIHKMDYEPHSLWIVKLNDEVFGPFEVESLKHYAIENEVQFQHALASRMDTSDWQPFFSHSHFLSIPDHSNEDIPEVEKYWIMNMGQKVGPLSRLDVDKKIELGILSMSDLVSVDDGNTWLKFFSHGAFTPQINEIGAPPMAPLESSFQRAREVLHETMDNQERTGTHVGLAALTFLGHHKGKPGSILEEMDIKALDETEISRSLKWAIPTAVAGLAALVVMGSFVFSPSNDMTSTGDDKTEISSGGNKSFRKNNSKQRAPANYQPHNPHRSGLTNSPVIHENEYPNTQVETHYNEPDSPLDQPMEAENQAPPEPQEHSLVSNSSPENETLDQAMGGEPVEAAPPEPVVEASDF